MIITFFQDDFGNEVAVNQSGEILTPFLNEWGRYDYIVAYHFCWRIKKGLNALFYCLLYVML